MELYFQEQDALTRLSQVEFRPFVREQLQRLVCRIREERAALEDLLLEIYSSPSIPASDAAELVRESCKEQ